MVTFPAVSLAGNETNPFYLECQTVHMYMMDVCQSIASSTMIWIMLVGQGV